MKMSSAFQELEADQEVTCFSLSIVKNLINKASLGQESLSPIFQREGVEISQIRNSFASSPMSYRQKYSGQKQSFVSVFDLEYYPESSSPTLKEDSSPRLSSESPLRIGERISIGPEESPIQIISNPPGYDGNTNTISCFTENFGPEDCSEIMPSVGLITRQEFSHRLHKEGWLQKKATNIFIGWQKRYFEVRPFKIYYAKSLDMLKTNQGIRSINLLVHRCEVIGMKETVFSIKIEGIQKQIKLKADTLREAIEWVDFLKEFFAYAKNHCYQGQRYLSLERKKLPKVDTITEEDFIKEASTGDLLLFKFNPTQTNKQKRIIGTNTLDRISLVVRVLDETYLYDANRDQVIKEKIFCLKFSGNTFEELERVQGEFSRPCSKYVKYSFMLIPILRVVYRKLHIDDHHLKSLIQTRLYKFLMAHQETKHDPNLDKTLEDIVYSSGAHKDYQMISEASISSALGAVVMNSPPKHPTQASPFDTPEKNQAKIADNSSSAHLIALAYKYAGLLDAHMPTNQYLPMSFSKKIDLQMGAYLSGEYELALLN